jgi:hypothetical protein
MAAKTEKQKRSRSFLAVLNNWTEEELKAISDTICPKTKVWIIGKEVGEQGTPHLQMFFKFENQVWWSNFKTYFEKANIRPPHIEVARSTAKKNLEYCAKDGDFTTNFEGTIGKFVKAVGGVKRKRTTQGNITTYNAKVIEEDYAGVEWRPWQQFVLDEIAKPANRRKIIWIWDKTGNIGKSFLSMYIQGTTHSVCAGGKWENVALEIKEATHGPEEHPFEESQAIQAVIMDVPRTQGNKVSYLNLEKCKSGMIQSGKYRSCSFLIRAVHVIIFANEEPKWCEMSADRFEVYEIVDGVAVKTPVPEQSVGSDAQKGFNWGN